ncbi:hypothetical protein FE634_15525 [Nocardioides dongxiaopingii]|uniref:hypothetical protein n=1 Tax=Nocardioides sp. S-1144 TaxID=2582905 RepID=UPI00110D5CAF|nr:hypothetical protein [Nocardioides sp. S-1144]QCW51466.1 hypothetical protein FE634_15525 [Nocardioides sp. S-1144]
MTTTSPSGRWASSSASQARSVSSRSGVRSAIAMSPAWGRLSMVRTGMALSQNLWKSAIHSGS